MMRYSTCPCLPPPLLIFYCQVLRGMAAVGASARSGRRLPKAAQLVPSDRPFPRYRTLGTSAAWTNLSPR